MERSVKREQFSRLINRKIDSSVPKEIDEKCGIDPPKLSRYRSGQLGLMPKDYDALFDYFNLIALPFDELVDFIRVYKSKIERWQQAHITATEELKEYIEGYHDLKRKYDLLAAERDNLKTQYEALQKKQ